MFVKKKEYEVGNGADYSYLFAHKISILSYYYTDMGYFGTGKSTVDY